MTPDEYRKRAHDFLARIPLIDAHNDFPFVLRERSQTNAYDFPENDTDLSRLPKGKVGGQFWAAFTPPELDSPLDYALRQIALIKRLNIEYDAILEPALCAEDVDRAFRKNKIASFICIENGAFLSDSLELIPLMHELGVRYLTLCHNMTLPWIDSATDAPRSGGLAAFGEKVVATCNAFGIAVDLSHASHEAQLQVLAVAKAPALITHANAFSLVDHPRNVRDETLHALKNNRGVVCATFVPAFASQATYAWMKKGLLDSYGKTSDAALRDMSNFLKRKEEQLGPCPQATLEDVCDHITYFVNAIGVDHVGIGSDYYGANAPEGLHDVSCFPDLIAALMARGWSDDNLARLASQNLLRVLSDVEARAKTLTSPNLTQGACT